MNELGGMCLKAELDTGVDETAVRVWERICHLVCGEVRKHGRQS
jgi:hypothetical protein